MPWYDNMTPQQAKDWLDTPIQIKVVGCDAYGRDVVAPTNLPQLRVIDAIRKIAERV